MADEIKPNFDELNRFQWDILFIIEQAESNGSTLHGLGIKGALEETYEDTEVYHGRLYPSLDTLVEEGLIEKAQRDERTNIYRLTDIGEDWVGARREFVTNLFEDQ